MVGMVIVAHAGLGDALVESANLLCGVNEPIHTIGLYHGDDVEELKKKVQQVLKECEQYDETLVFADLFGGTPCNTAAAVIHESYPNGNVALYAGVNVPMMVQAVLDRDNSSLEEMKRELDILQEESICNVLKKLGME